MNLEGEILKENAILLHKCCVCDKYKSTEKDRNDKNIYVRVDEALSHIYETNEHFLISHGYCPDCMKAEMEKLQNGEMYKDLFKIPIHIGFK